MHAYLRCSLNTIAAHDGLQVDHGNAAMRIAFLTSLYAGLAADTARVVDEKLHAVRAVHRTPPACICNSEIASCGAGTLLTRTAQILYSGIFEIGSMARTVILLAARSSGQ